jgi:monomeric sarcosine oxidase
MKRRTFLGAAIAAPVAANLRIAAATAGAGPHIAVIGASAFGGWTALELVRRGARVTLIVGWGPGNSRASSGGETRVIRSAYADPIYVRMAQRALQLWRENESAFGQRLFHPVGVLFMAQRPGLDFLATAERNLVGEGVKHETLDARTLSQRYPQIAFDGIERALYEPEGGYLLARRSCALVADAFAAAGGRYVRQHARPIAIGDGDIAAIKLEDDTNITADTFIFACGPWLRSLFPDLLEKGLAATRQEILYFGTPAADRRYYESALPVWADVGDRLWYGIPGNEDRGFKIADDTRGPPFDPTDGERKPSEEGVAAARAFIARRFPSMARAPLVEARVCQYEQTPDAHFIVDQHPRAANVWLVGGGSGHGFKHGPALGEHVAMRVLGQVAAEPKFSLARFAHATSG